MKPILIVSMILGGASGIATFSLFNVGLVAGPSPGSIFAYLALTPKGNFIGVIAGVLVATLVSFLVTSLILKGSNQKDEDFEGNVKKSKDRKQEGKDLLSSTLKKDYTNNGIVKLIAFACDAGLGSSAMGASAFRKRAENQGLNVTVKNYSIEKVPQDADVIVTHKNLLERTRLAWPQKRIVTIDNFMKDSNIDDLLSELVEQKEQE